MKTPFLAATMALFSAGMASGTVFLLNDTTVAVGNQMDTVVVDGISLNLLAVSFTDENAVLGGNSDQIGVHSDGEATGEEIDAIGSVIEFINFSFDQDVMFHSISTGSHTANETAVLAISGNGVFDFVGGGAGDTGFFEVNEFVPAGTDILLTPDALGQAFGLAELDVTFIPEPSAAMLALAGGLAAFGIRRRQRVS